MVPPCILLSLRVLLLASSSGSPPMETQKPKRKSIGRQKIPIRKIDKDQARQICFSKRRAGLFKKASELSVLCGVEIAAVVFSPAGKVFTFGNPSVEAVVERFLVGGAVPSGAPPPPDLVGELDARCKELSTRLEAEKKKREEVETGLNKAREERRYWREPEDLDAFGAEELGKLKSSVEQLKKRLERRAETFLRGGSSAGNAAPGLQGSSSSTG